MWGEMNGSKSTLGRVAKKKNIKMKKESRRGVGWPDQKACFGWGCESLNLETKGVTSGTAKTGTGVPLQGKKGQRHPGGKKKKKSPLYPGTQGKEFYR